MSTLVDREEEAVEASPRAVRGRWVAGAAVVVGVVMLVAAWPPVDLGSTGSLLQTVLPWCGLSVPLLLVAAAVRGSRLTAVAAVVPGLVWCSAFGPLFLPGHSGGRSDLTVVSHNVHDANPDPEGTARTLAASGARLLALEELTEQTAPRYEKALAGTYPYHEVFGGVGVWSAYRLRDAQVVPIMPWTRAMRVTVDTPKGPLALYVAHLASVRVSPSAGFTTERRNEAAERLAAAVRAEPLRRTVVVGDFNGSTDDSALRPVTGQLSSAQEEAGRGFGFSWPAAFPVVRLDQILVRSVTATSAWTLPRTGSDHLPVAAALRL